ncbi:MAG: flagellar filament capping protein FliD [Clostridiales bacterium]|nr:flagellar filament capping protein FliD [Clostridiales bacterium]
MATSSNRITGLATGLDIDSIVKSSMQAYQNKIDKVYRQKSLAEIRQQLYKDVIKDGKKFYNDYLDLTKSGNIVASSAFKSVGFMSSDESVATAVGGADALKSNYRIEVRQKATAANLSVTIDQLGITEEYKLDAGKSIQITSDTESSTAIISAEDLNRANITSDKELAKFLNNRMSSAGYKVYTSDFNSGKIVFEAAQTGDNKVFHITAGSVNPEHIDNGVAGPLTLTSIMNKVDDKYSDSQDIQITYGGDTKVIKADTLRSYIESYNAQNSKIDGLTQAMIDSGVLMDSKSVGADTEENKEIINKTKEAINAMKSALISHRQQLAKNAAANETAISDCDSKITKVSDILSKFTDDTAGVSLSDDDKALLSGLLTDSKTYNKEKLENDLTDITKSVFGTDDTEARNPKVVAYVDNGEIKFKDNATNAYINYSVGKRVYEQVTPDAMLKNPDNTLTDKLSATDGKNLAATITNTATNETIIYDNANKSSSNTITIDGAAITINNTGTTNLTAKTDVTELKDKIVKFVNGYNEYVTKLNTLLTEKKYRDYQPLTEEQKKEMKETEIKAWEEKVKSGQLRGDSDIQRIRDNMVNAMTNMVSGAGITLKDMGISLVDSYGTSKDGTFTIDEEKLTSALENRTEDVSKLFTTKGNNDATNGIAYRLKDICENEFVYSSKSLLIQKAGYEGTKYDTSSTLSKQITEYKNKLEDLQKWFKDKEQSLYSKWANIETIMNNYNSQASYLSSMFNSGS